MSTAIQLRAFRAVVFALAGFATLVGLSGAFGGLEAMATVFDAGAPGAVDASLRDHLRAICAGFIGYGWLTAWAAWALDRARTAFRIGVAVGVVAGLGRVTGWMVDGPPGALATLFAGIELVAFPLLLIWHTRLLGRAPPEPRAD